MTTLNKNINFCWYGTDCANCDDYSFYSGLDLKPEFQNVISIISVKSGGYVYSGWKKDVHENNKKEFEKLPDLVKNTLGVNFLKNGQSFDKFECGTSYIIELAQNTELKISNLFSANIDENKTHRLVNPCPVCESKPDCNCVKIPFIFKKFDLNTSNYGGWQDDREACFDNQLGIVHSMTIDSEVIQVGTSLYLEDRVQTPDFLTEEYIKDDFNLNDEYIFYDNYIYRIIGRRIVEIIDCESIKPTPTPTLILDPPIDTFCISYSSIEKNNGEYALQTDQLNNRPVWKSDLGMYSYYGEPAGAGTKRWMISPTLNSKFGQFADTEGGSGPYDRSWDNNDKYYHTISTRSCEEVSKYWIQRGNCVNGERVNTKAGDSVSINEDGSIIAFGTEKNSDSGIIAGQTRVYRLVGSSWTQMGQDLEHSQTNSKFGHSISLSADGSILAVGAYNDTRTPIENNEKDKNIGSVRVYKWNTTSDSWEQFGQTLYGKGQGDSFGISCELNESGNVLLISALGYFSVYGFVTESSDDKINTWVELGNSDSIDFSFSSNKTIGVVSSLASTSSFSGDYTNRKISTKIIVAVAGDKNCIISRYDTDTDKFLIRGSVIQIPSQTAGNNFILENAPSSISLDKYGDTIAVGVPNIQPKINDLGLFDKGEVNVYKFNGVSEWNKLGKTLTGDVNSLKLGPAGTTLIYSSITHTVQNSNVSGELLSPGAIFAYELNDTSWDKIGEVLYGKTHEDKFGYALDFTLHSNKIILVSSATDHTIYSDSLDDYLGQICIYESPPEYFEVLPDPVDCVFTQTEWSQCSQDCDPDGSGPGQQTRTTTIISEPIGGGLECPGTTIIQTCGEDRCPIDCQVSDWTWSGSCSKECDGGIETASRTIITKNQFGGTECPDLETTRPCNTFVCPEDCEGNFQEISPCTVSCGGGVRQLAFNVTKPEVGTGLCPNRGKIIEEECNLEPCPVDCVGDWSDWSQCTASCDGGKQTRSFVVSDSEKFGGECPNRNKIETRDCNTQGCPKDCEGYYTSWTTCSQSCGGGTQTKSFVVTKSESNGGTCENRGTIQSQACNTNPCPENCEGYWDDYGPCSKECGGGTQTRSFIVTKDELYGGICPNRNGIETRNCNSNPCPRDCSGYWSPWSSCSRTCGGGTQSRYFVVRTSEAYGGVCPDKGARETRSCNTSPCPTNCEGYWSAWTTCTETCGGGTQTRTFVVSKSEANGGTCVNRDKTESRSCNTQCCKQDCEGYWTEWGYNNVAGRCSKCGDGQQTRKWVTTKPQSCGGTCPQYNGKLEVRYVDESICGCCPENCEFGYKTTCNQDSDKIDPPDNLIYEMEFPYVAKPAKCGGTCASIDDSRTKYDWCDEKGPPMPVYKVTGFGGVEGTQIEDKLFYPVLQKGTGSNQFLLRVGPQKKSYNTRKSQPPQGYYNFTCLDGYSSLNDYNLTPCDGNRKYLYMTKSFSTSSKVSLYSTLYRYILAWSYRGGRTCSYSYIPVGGSSNSNWCPFYREHAIQNEDGSYRGVNSLYGWVLIKQYYSALPSLFSRSSGVQWKFSNMYGWSYQPTIGKGVQPDPNTISGYYSPYPTDGELLKYSTYRWGTNMNPSHSTKYTQRASELGFTSEFGTIKKVDTIPWGEGHLRSSSWHYKYKE